MADISDIIMGYPYGVDVRVAPDGLELEARDGEVIRVTKGCAATNGSTMWMVQDDYDALKARLSAVAAQPDDKGEG